jgi:hypothetical protein
VLDIAHFRFFLCTQHFGSRLYACFKWSGFLIIRQEMDAEPTHEILGISSISQTVGSDKHSIPFILH